MLASVGVVGFEVDFPAIRAAQDRLKGSDFACRMLARDASTALDAAASATGVDSLSTALGALANALESEADKTANQVRALWRAVGKSESDYYASEQANTRDIAAARFTHHDGHQ